MSRWRHESDRLVYRKPTHTERYLSFHSHPPVAHKRAVVKSLTDRAKTISSSNDQRSKEMKHVTAALVANGYPKRFVIDVAKPKRLAQQLHRMLQRVSVLYHISRAHGSLSNEFWVITTSKLLKNHTKPSGLWFLNRKTQYQSRDAIYSIPCKDCDKSYIGETKRKFSTRLKEHQKAVEHKHSQKSALAEHCLRSGHTVSWEAAKILRTSASWRNRRILEAWEINTCS